MISPDHRMKACKGAHQDPEEALACDFRVQAVVPVKISASGPGGDALADAAWKQGAKAGVRGLGPVPLPTFSEWEGYDVLRSDLSLLPVMPVMPVMKRSVARDGVLNEEALSEERRKADLLIEALSAVDASFAESRGVSPFTFVMWRSRAVAAILREFRDWDER